jgi:WD40 repeat protein
MVRFIVHICLSFLATAASGAGFDMVVQSPHVDSITTVAVSPDGRHYATGSVDGRVLLYRRSDDRIVRSYQTKGAIRRVAFSPDGTRLALATGDLPSVRIWNIRGNDEPIGDDARFVARDVAFAGDGKVLVAALGNGGVAAYSAADAKLLAVQAGHRDEASFIAINGENLVASADRDGNVILRTLQDVLRSPRDWQRARAQTPGVVLRWKSPSKIVRIAFSADGRYLGMGTTGETYGTLRFLDVRTGKEVNQGIYCGYDGDGLDFAFSPDGRHLAVSADRLSFMVFRWAGDLTDKGRCESRLEVKSIRNSGFSANAIVFTPDGKTIVAGGGKLKGNTFPGVYDVRFHALDGTSQPRAAAPPIQRVASAEVSADGTLLAVGMESGVLDVWDLVELRRLASIYTDKAELTEVGISPGPDRPLIAAMNWNGDTWVWDARTLRLVARMRLPEAIKRNLSEDRVRARGFGFVDGGKALLIDYRIDGENRRRLARWDIGSDIVPADRDDLVPKYPNFGRHPRFPVVPGDASIDPPNFPIVGDIAPTRDSVVIWNRAGMSRVSLASSPQDWIAFANDGTFDASRNGGALLAMSRGEESFGIDQFALRLNRPDRLLERLWGRKTDVAQVLEAQWQRRLRRAKLDDAPAEFGSGTPTVTIVRTEQRNGMATLAARIASPDSDLLRAHLYVNDVPVGGVDGFALKGRQASLEKTFRILPGDNKVEVSAVNAAGDESPRALVRFAGPEEKLTPNMWVLAFGVSKYRDPSLDLRYASRDAVDLARAFEAMEGPTTGFAKVRTKVLTDAQVTPSAIRAARDFFAKARPEDAAVVFIAGHGAYDRASPDGAYHYLSHGTRLDDLAGTAVRFEDIEHLLFEIVPRRKLFLMDTCESGEDDEPERVAAAQTTELRSRGLRLARPEAAPAPRVLRDTQRDRYIFNDLIRRSGAIVFSSSRGSELSYEADAFGHGLFTEAILQSLRDKTTDGDGDGRLSILEMRDYVAKRVADMSAGLQNPVIDRDNITVKFDFPFPARTGK